ncbi:MAG: dTMP kinase [Myxococcota bacterium]|nr:dTMP kinase [Myxococcota bacterium]
MNAGRLVAFEGIDGCGKSTQVERLARALREAGHDLVVTAEPTRGRWGRRIREMARSGEPVTAEEELRWFFADRREHVAEVLAPALAAGQLVITDRYYLSSVAYQGARGLDWREILADSEAEFPVPDLVLLLEIEPGAGLERVHGRGHALESVFEDADRLARVAGIFSQLDRPYLERVDAAAAPDEVEARVREALARRLGIEL